MDKEFWVFGYGSLMWNPGFEFLESQRAELRDHRRSFCLASVRYRGTPERPGLVLALEPRAGASCSGVAFRIAAERARETIAYLRERELGTKSYHEMQLPLKLSRCGSQVTAVCYVIDTGHDQYRCGLPLEEQARIIAFSSGPAGPNHEYLFNTLTHLRELNVGEPEIEALAARVETLRKAAGESGAPLTAR